MSTLGQQGGHRTLALQDDVEVTLGGAPALGSPPSARPFDPHGAELPEGGLEALLRDVPGHASQEHLQEGERSKRSKRVTRIKRKPIDNKHHLTLLL